MKRLPFLFLAVAWAGSAWGQGIPDRSAPGCVAGPSEPAPPPLPPQSVAICHYPATELHARIERLLAVRPGELGSKEIERIFSLPTLSLTHHDPRSTNLGVSLHSAPGSAWWRTILYLQEGFFGPKFEGPPIPLRGLQRPVPIEPRTPGEILVRIVQADWLGSPAPDLAPCLTVAALLDGARRNGWTPAPRSPPVSPHAPPGTRIVEMNRDGLSLMTEYQDEKACLDDFLLVQSADPRPGD